MKHILVVIDMQEGAARGRYHRQYLNRKWWARHATAVTNVRSLVGKMDTIFVVYTGFRNKRFVEIIPELRDVASGALVVFKDKDDGSDVLAEHLSLDTRILLCGMNTNACVLRTARGLKKKGFFVMVIGDACWTAYASKSAKPHNNTLSRLRRIYGISVIKASAVR